MARSRKRPRILIAGIGNVLLMDDGVGVHAVEELKMNPPPNCLIAEVGTATFNALHLFEWADKILAIDAMQAGGSPGTLYSFTLSDIEERGPQTSLHELNLLAALRLLNRSLPETLVLGVEPETINYGLELSPSVKASLPHLVQTTKKIVAQWKRHWTQSLLSF